MPKAFCMISGFCQWRLTLFISLEIAAGYNWMFADSRVRGLEKQPKRSAAYRRVQSFLEDYTINYIHLYSSISSSSVIFHLLAYFTGCGKPSLICRPSVLLTNKEKAYNSSTLIILFWKKRYSWPLCELLLSLTIPAFSPQQSGL